jgi:hypothetical protein
MQIVNNAIDMYMSSSIPISTTISKPLKKDKTNFSSFLELMSAHSFLSKDAEETSEASSIACQDMEKMGFNPDRFYAEFIRIDFGTAGLHQYCLFGGFNRFVSNVLKNKTKNKKALNDLATNMTAEWHEKLASYVGVILWSKVKVSPLLRGSLMDDSLSLKSTRKKKLIEKTFQSLVIQAMLAYSKNPF